MSMSASGMEIVGSDDNAVYLSMSGNLQSEEGSSVIVAFGAITLVKQLPIGVYAYEKQGTPSGELPTDVAENYLQSVFKTN